MIIITIIIIITIMILMIVMVLKMVMTMMMTTTFVVCRCSLWVAAIDSTIICRHALYMDMHQYHDDIMVMMKMMVAKVVIWYQDKLLKMITTELIGMHHYPDKSRHLSIWHPTMANDHGRKNDRNINTILSLILWGNIVIWLGKGLYVSQWFVGLGVIWEQEPINQIPALSRYRLCIFGFPQQHITTISWSEQK